MNNTLWPMLLANIFPKERFNGDPGDTILWTRSAERSLRLHVVITPPYGDPPRVVIVGLISKRPRSDTTVVLGPSDHPSIDSETIVNCERADVIPLERLEQGFADGIAKPQVPFSADVLKTILRGILDSSRTPLATQQLCRRMWHEQPR
jgi:hypothetical protein